MKRYFCLLLIIAVGSHFGISRVFAQKRSPEVIIVEFSYPNEGSHKYEIPVNKSPDGKLDAGGGSVSECGIPEDPECAKTPYSTYKWRAKAFAVKKNLIRVDFKIDLHANGEDCQTSKIFTVRRKQQTRINLSCDITLVAYYGLESKEAN